mgnify:CR=1 FL=1
MKVFDKTPLEGVKYTIVVASGKGGVGKSTVSANLAMTLADKGYKVALVDADIYGPSIPKIFDVENERPCLSVKADKDGMMDPIQKYGVKINSLGFFADKGKSIVWRGPMASNAITQLFTQTYWDDIDYMIIDFPPGTGDIQITAVQKFEIDGAIVVTTPQELSLNDARKGTEMLTNENIHIPLIGVVENMSWFTPLQHPDEKYFIFGKNGGQTLADEFSVPLLAQIPLIKEVGELAEQGKAFSALDNKDLKLVFEQLAEVVVAFCEEKK